MTPAEQQADRRLRGDPNGEPLSVVLYRLEQIERRMDRLMSSELYAARHEALQARVLEVEREQDESARSVRQIAVGLVVAIGAALATAGITIL